MVKTAAIFCFITALLIYGVTIIAPFLIDPSIVFILLRFAIIIFALGVILGFIHVITERRQEKKKEDWDKLKDY
ncbi:MAG: hypothetical protein VR72_01815 [Clostridiaceae bacterium BRH_c20a]|nr:MAG: hypothetical protein VR72_01815 [Clostridiaceae bacterium BRH_c20a]